MAGTPGHVRFSFIVIAYCDRLADYAALSECLASIEAQTCPDWEAVVVHDGPNPTARETIAEWAIGRPQRVVYLEVPYRGIRGGHASVNPGVELAQGEFVAVLNGDNTIEPTYVERLHADDADILTCMVRMRDMPGLVLDGTGFARGRIDRANYAIRRPIAQRVTHRMHLDADYDWLIDCFAHANERRPVRVHHVLEILATHK